MTKIQIIKSQDGYTYRYYLLDENNKPYYVKKSGFTTPETALEAAKKSYKRRINAYNKSKNTSHPIHVTKTKHTKKKEHKSFSIKNFAVSDGGYRILEALAFSAVVLVTTAGTIKIINDVKNLFPKRTEIQEEETEDTYKELITVDKCDFDDLYIVLRTAESETNGVGVVNSDMLNKLGIPNEIVSKDSDLSSKVSNAINNNPDSNIVVINIESGLENKKTNNTTVMGDFSNRRQYPSDILASCINVALNDYSFNSSVRSGIKADIWRKDSEVEVELTNSGLINEVCQLTIDLPLTVAEDQLTKNDAAASIIEGIMRWTTLDVTERYKDIYYTTQYGDNIVSIMQDHGVSIQYIQDNSDIDMRKDARVGNCVLVAPLPKVVTNTIVYNPCTTTDATQIEPVSNIYVVQSGDTVTKIANMYGMKIDDIVVPSGNINNIQIGDVLYITTYNLYETHIKNGNNEKTSEKQIYK